MKTKMKTDFKLTILIAILILFACTKPEEVKNATNETSTLSVLNTSDVSSITTITAICSGNIKSDGSSTIITRGVCWNTSQFPTTANNKTIEVYYTHTTV